MNLNTTGTFAGVFHVHVKASLCGQPWKADDVKHMFLPWREQAHGAHRLFNSLPSKAESLWGHLNQHLHTVQGAGEELDAAYADFPMFAYPE